MKRCLAVAMTAVLATMFMVGCGTHNQTLLDENGLVKTVTSTASVASMSGDGRLSAAYQGVAPGQAMQDSESTWLQVPGIFSAITFAPDGRLMLTTPQDVAMEGVEYCPAPAPGQSALKVAKLTMRSTEALAQNVAALHESLPILVKMTQAEAKARIEQTATLSPDLKDLLLGTVVPLLAP